MFAIFSHIEHSKQMVHNKTTKRTKERERNYGKFYVGLKFLKIKGKKLSLFHEQANICTFITWKK